MFRKYRIPTLLVDAGDIFDGTEAIDTQRCQMNLKAMSLMAYDAVALSQSDLAYGDAYISGHRDAVSFPFLGESDIHTLPSVLKTVGKTTVALIHPSNNGELPDADILIALGEQTSAAPREIDVVISPEEVELGQQGGRPL
ncbi:MAG: hypothetical protein OXI24_04815, partial [Candidatus Poribacteria bacterium]|nr:hypothetical protein [Candidatus Poribacteria bacterium]